MPLTVPTAGSIAGRAPRIEVAQPQGAAVIAEFGQRMAEVGQRWQDEQRQRQGQRAQLDITRDLGLARQEVEQIGDPAQIGAAWDARVQAIREQYITPGMDPKLSEALDLSLRELSDRHSLALGNRVIGLQQSQREADWVNLQQGIVAEAATADPTTFGALIDFGKAAIDDRVASGGLDPATAAQQKIALEQDVYGARAGALLQSDPKALLAQIDAKEWDVMGDALPGLRQQAARAVAEIEAVGAKEAAKAAEEQAKLIGDRLKEIVAIAGKGGAAIDESLMADPQVQANPEYARAAAAIALRDEKPGIRAMTVAELDAEILREKNRPVAAEWQLERLQVLEQWRDEAARKSATDPVSYLRDSGLKVPDLPPLDPADPAPFAQGLSARLATDAAARKQGYAQAPAVFDAEELATYKAAADPKADPAQRLALARAFASQGATESRYLAGKVIGADPVFTRATTLIGTLGDLPLAEEMLRGQARMKAGTVNMPTGPDQVRVFDEVTGGVFDRSPALKAEIMAAAEALYADGAATVQAGDGTKWADNGDAIEAYTAALQRVIGGRKDKDGQYTIGGLQPFNGGLTYLPPGVAMRDLEATWDSLNLQLDISSSFDQQPGGAQVRLAGTPFAAASIVPGALPDLGPEPGDILYDLQLRPVLTRDGQPTDVYELTYQHNGATVVVPQANDPDGRAYRFKLPALIREARK